ncbi:hypothetical protein C8F04DRAFT_565170 [Mycena alexandri]|uniref:F-box domain-containing protein n=1 Tax=Mycena alexandri TaxID=1745969 RepID=A0AAD6RWG6_9AGAR|nr:hypothetical protein C8F04DRAFT_565170 [Mycena alexandri]
MDSSSYPVLTLPTEIVCKIFTYFLPIYPLCPPLFGITSPTTLTQICRPWREVALGTPVLWRAMELAMDGTPIERQLAAIAIWLRRSGGWPLSIRTALLPHLEDLSDFVALIALHRARWEHLDLHLVPEHLPTLEGSMPLLRRFHLELTRAPGIRSPRAAVAFQDARLLREVKLDDVAAEHVILPWAQLTSLRLNRVYPRECVAILKETPNLVYCELRLFDDHHASPVPDILHPHLETLILLEGQGPVANYLGTFIVPSLLTLRVPEPFLGPSPIDSLASFISKSRCELKDVRITNRTLVLGDDYRKAFPSIEAFSFSRYHGGRSPTDGGHSDSPDFEDHSDPPDVEDNSDVIIIGH